MPRAKASAKKSQPMANSIQPTPTIVAFESSRTLNSDIEERIRKRAYELFIERGCQHGYAEKDWLRAEAEILAHSEKLTA